MKGNVRVSPDVTLSGNYSELFRLGPRSSSTLFSQTPQEARDALIAARALSMSPIVRTPAREYYINHLYSWVEQSLAEGVDYQRLGTRFMPEFLLRRKYGSGSEINSRIWMYPLYTPSAARIVHYLPAEQRQNERFHFDIIHRYSEDLATLPFVRKPWNPETYEHLAHPE